MLMKRWARWFLLVLILGLSSTVQGNAQVGNYKPGELFIGFQPDTPTFVQNRIVAQIGGRVIQRFDHLNAWLISVPPGKELAKAAAIQDDPAVAFAEPNYYIHAAIAPSDPDFATYQWNLARIVAPAAWDLERNAADVLIAIVDTGVNYNHPDLRATRWINPAESEYNPWLGRPICDQDGIDDDANGYVDDCYGWDWVDYDAAPLDQNGHGTQVAGIAAAATDNGIGMAGVGWGARFIPLRVLDSTGNGEIADLALALKYLEDITNQRVVVNLSLTLPPGVYSDLLERAIASAYHHGMLLVAASGNGGRSQVSLPAAYPGVLAVGATDIADRRWGLSNFGNDLDVVAPGADVYSTAYDFSYTTGSGTSFAAPHVSGLAALIWSANPHLTADEVAEIIRTTADDINADTEPGWDRHLGWGRINAGRALITTTRAMTFTLTADPPGVPIGGRTQITGTITDEEGRPVGTGLVIQFQAQNGTVTPATALSVNGIVTTTFTAGAVEGTGIVTMTLGEVARALPIAISSGAPYTISLQAIPPLLAAGGGPLGQAVLRAQVRDSAGHAVRDGTEVSFASDLGLIAPITDTTTDGLALSTLTSGTETGTAHVTATVGSLIATTTVAIVGPGQPFSLTLTATPLTVTVGGGQAIITATLRDVSGLSVAAGHPVTFYATGGVITPTLTQTDANGQATAVFTAGTALGSAIVTATSGPALTDQISLSIAPGEPYTITLIPKALEIEAGAHRVPITAVVTDRLGNPVLDGTFINFATTLGQMTAQRTATKDGKAHSELRAGPSVGIAHITATADNDAQGAVDIQIVPGPVRRLLLSATADSVEVGGRPITITAQGWDAFNNPMRDGTSVHFRTNLGMLGTLNGSPQGDQLEVQAEEGQARVRFFPPGEPGVAYITASAGPTATQTLSITVVPGSPAQLTVTADATYVLVGTSTTVRAEVRDGLGNPVADGTTVHFATTLGEVSPRNAPTVNGIAETTFQAGSEPGNATIGVTVDSLFEVITIRVRGQMYYFPLVLRE